MKALNFNTMKKQYLTVTLADEKNTVLMIGSPTKAVMDKIISIQSYLTELEQDETNTEAISELYDVCAKIMSRNKGGIQITSEYLSEIFDFEDILIFFNAYIDFVSGITNEKN